MTERAFWTGFVAVLFFAIPICLVATLSSEATGNKPHNTL